MNEPESRYSHAFVSEWQNGLTKREYFAGQAMVGYASSVPKAEFDNIAHWSVELADALINALNKPS